MPDGTGVRSLASCSSGSLAVSTDVSRSLSGSAKAELGSTHALKPKISENETSFVFIVLPHEPRDEGPRKVRTTELKHESS